MRTKQEFADAFADELAGFLLSALMQADKPDMAERGRFISHRLAMVRPMLAKYYDFIAGTEPIKSTTETLTEELIKALPELTPEGLKACKDRLRLAFEVLNGKVKK